MSIKADMATKNGIHVPINMVDFLIPVLSASGVQSLHM